MRIRGRSCIAAFMACAILLFVSAPAHPSYNTEAGRKYAVASSASRTSENPTIKEIPLLLDRLHPDLRTRGKKIPEEPERGGRLF